MELQVLYLTSLTTRGYRLAGDDADAIFELLLEADVDVDDVEAEEGTIITVYTAPTDLQSDVACVNQVSKNSK